MHDATMNNRETPSTYDKALRINLDEEKYGTFAEIGAGQEVAKWFFEHLQRQEPWQKRYLLMI